MGKKYEYKPKSFESVGGVYLDRTGKKRKESSANIYESMLISEAFRTLTDRQKALYLYCKAQYFGKHKPMQDFKDVPELQNESYFYLSWHMVQEYGSYKESMQGNFSKDMKALAEHGLIRVISQGKARGHKSIYAFDNGWRTWQQS